MKVVCPYTQLRPETRAALELHSPVPVEYVDVSSDEQAMWRLWSRVWSEREDVVWVEHDIVIDETVIPAFVACREPWCVNPYPYFTNLPYGGTGCVRFRRELMLAVPNLWELVAEREGPHHPKKHWCSLDGFSQLELWPRGFKQHMHEHLVGHLDTEASHSCRATF